MPDSVRKLTKKYLSDDCVSLNLLQGNAEQKSADAEDSDADEDDDEVIPPIIVLPYISFSSLALCSNEKRFSCSESRGRVRFQSLSSFETSSKGQTAAMVLVNVLNSFLELHHLHVNGSR